MEVTVWALVVGLVVMLAKMAGGRPATIGLVVLPLVAPIVPYVYAQFCMPGDHLGAGFVLFLGLPLTFAVTAMLSIAVYCWVNREAVRESLRHDGP